MVTNSNLVHHIRTSYWSSVQLFQRETVYVFLVTVEDLGCSLQQI